jgi:hypothetical protein
MVAPKKKKEESISTKKRKGSELFKEANKK